MERSMSWKVVARIAGYFLAGIVTALGMLAVETYPGERTWVTTVVEKRRESKWDREFRPRTVFVDCGWRVLGCEELPTRQGPLAHMADSALGNVDSLLCVRSPFPPPEALA